MLTTSITPLLFYRHLPCVEPSNATRMKDKKAPRKKKNRATRRTNSQQATRRSTKRYVHTSTHGPWTTDKISDFNYIASGINIFRGSAKYEVESGLSLQTKSSTAGGRPNTHPLPSSMHISCYVLCALVCMLRLALYCCSTTCNVHRSTMNQDNGLLHCLGSTFAAYYDLVSSCRRRLQTVTIVSAENARMWLSSWVERQVEKEGSRVFANLGIVVEKDRFWYGASVALRQIPRMKQQL